MKSVAVLGGGPAGSFAAERLARAGLKTILIDEKHAWEKPCGGGLTERAYKQYPYLLNNNTPKRVVTETHFAAHEAGAVKMTLSQPLVIYSRFDLNRMLLERAEKAGAQIEKTRVQEIERQGSGWSVRTRNGSLQADYCVIATGARNPLRNVGTELTPTDTMVALGYYVAADQPHIDVQFLHDLEGYIWIFPRCGHLSVGIGGKGEPTHSLRTRLERYMDERGIRYRGAPFFAHVIPSLDTASWPKNRIAGDAWIAVGDAAGLVDPITGEGLAYAMRSGDLASQVILDETVPIAAKAAAYATRIREEFADDLAYASTLAHRLYLGEFMRDTVPSRMVQFARHSRRFSKLLGTLMHGGQPYLTLKRKLYGSLFPTLLEIGWNVVLGRREPAKELTAES